MAQLKFYRKATAPTSNLVAGAIWFNTEDKTIQVYTGTTWEKYAGNLKDASWSGTTLTITKHDGSNIALDFSDMASATIMGKMISAIGLNTTGEFKANAANYGGASIGEEIKNIDAALWTLSDNTSKSFNDLKGTLTEDDAATLEAINAELNGIDTKISDIEADYLTSDDKNNIITTLQGTESDAETVLSLEGVKKYATERGTAALTAAKSYTDAEIQKLDVTDTAVANKYVSAVSETDGKISVSREALPVTGVATDDKLLTLNGDKITSTIAFSYSSTNKKISLTGVNGEEIGSVDTTDFIKDGMLSKAEFNETTHVLTLTFNTDAGEEPITVDLSKLVDTYKAGIGLELAADGTFNVNTNVIASKTSVDTLSSTVEDHHDELVALASTTVNGKAIGITTGDEVSANTIVLSGADVAITGYTKGTAEDLTASDTINAALGKLEARVDAAAAGGVQSINGHVGAVTISEGSTNGTITINGTKGVATSVPVKGLGSAAYTESSAYATSAQGAKADKAITNIVNADGQPFFTVTSFTGTSPDRNAVVKFNLSTASEMSSGHVTKKETFCTAKDVIDYTQSSITDALAWAEFD